MPINRRQFIKQSAGMVSLSLLVPKILVTPAQAQTGSNRRIYVVIQFGGGNDGLNTLVPYTNSIYHSMRPVISFRDSELKTSAGDSTIISNDFGLHPAMGEIKSLYDQGRVAFINGVGYPNPNLSHFQSEDIWYTASPENPSGFGWLGKYADQKLASQTGLVGAALGNSPPKALLADDVVIPSISNFNNYTFRTDNRFRNDRTNKLNTLNANNNRTFDAGSLLESIAGIGEGAIEGAQMVQDSVASYSSPVTYPAQNNLANAMRMAAQLITTMPQVNLLYVQMGGFDNHSTQIAAENGQPNKLAGAHFNLLRNFSTAVKAFYDDMAAHGLADNVVMMQWSEFGRRPNENASLGTDHGTSSIMTVIGNPVEGGIYGEMPSMTDLDRAGNMKFTVDFRSVYATILDRWLQADSSEILGSQFENIGFLG